jgi:cytochrome P450
MTIKPMRFPSGATGWVITSAQLGRAMLTDPRFSANRTNAESPLPGFTRGSAPPARRGAFITMDPPEHTRYRKLLTGQFSVPRMRQLEPRIEQIVDDHLDSLARDGKPADLVAGFALPVPSLVICELLGVDYADRAEFQSYTQTLFSTTISAQDKNTARIGLITYLQQLVRRKRAEPDDALIAGLTGDLDDEELANIALLLLVAGHETTATMLGLGTFTLLRHPDQMALLRADPDLIPGAVEELVRYLSIIGVGIVRVATENITLGDVEVQAGETVVLATPEANQTDDGLDVTRPHAPHLAFGHGIHACLGQQLARMEMRVGWRLLLERFPGLSLAVPADEVPRRTGMVMPGVRALPVTW